jgi:dihydrofolate reductase
MSAAMSTVILDISMSLDGFVTGPDDGPHQGLGEGGEVLHHWVFGRRWTADDGEDRTLGTGPVGVDKQVLDEALNAGGCSVVGRRMYEVAGAWGGRSPFGPCVVVTHRVEDQPPPESEFVFVSGIEAAVERARELAGDGPVGIGGGASVAQQALRAGLVDRLSIHVAPVVLGGGRTLFGMLGTRVDLEPERVLPSPFATHLAYRVLR